MGRHSRITNLPDGTPIADLVERLRGQKDLTVRERCAEVGLNPDSMTDYGLVWRLCRANGFVTRHVPDAALARHNPPPPIEQGANPAALQLAKAELARQVALAREESAYAPPYMGGGVDW